MSFILDSIKSLLVADVDVLALVGTRIFTTPAIAAAKPLIKLQRITGTDHQVLEGSCGSRENIIQAMAVSETSEAAADAIQEAIRLALQGQTNIISEGITINSIWLNEGSSPISLNVPPKNKGGKYTFQVSCDYYVHYQVSLPKAQTS